MIHLIQDYELVRCFDSLVYESEDEEETTRGLNCSGSLNESQTRQVAQLGPGLCGQELMKLERPGALLKCGAIATAFTRHLNAAASIIC